VLGPERSCRVGAYLGSDLLGLLEVILQSRQCAGDQIPHLRRVCGLALLLEIIDVVLVVSNRGGSCRLYQKPFPKASATWLRLARWCGPMAGLTVRPFFVAMFTQSF
jgi:hypothetical protein